MKAIVLAAGKGTRLRPLTYGIPKPLLPVKGVPVVHWVIDNISKCRDIDEIVLGVAGNSSDDADENSIAESHRKSIENYVKHVKEFRGLIKTIQTPQKETGGDLDFIIRETSLRGRILVAYGDNLTKIDIPAMLAYHERCIQMGISATVAVFEVPQKDASRFGIVETERKDNVDIITSFVEKPQKPKSRFANAGYYILELNEIREMIEDKNEKVERTLFPALVSRRKLAAFKADIPYWIDIGDKDSYNLANKLALISLDGAIIPPPSTDVKVIE